MGTGRDLWNQWEARTNKQDLAGLASLFANDGVYVTPNGRHEGREVIRAYFDEWGRAASQNMETSLVVEDGDTVVAEWTTRATLTGPLTLPDGTEAAATGKTVALAVVTVGMFRDGKFAAMREYFDNADLMRQLGLTAST